MFQRLLVCTTLSDGLQRLVDFVPSLAAANIQHITFLHCVPLNESGAIPRVDTRKVEEAQKLLTVQKHKIPEHVSVETKVETGRPVDVVFRVAAAQQSDLLLMGYSLRNSLTEKLFGSTTIELYGKATIPILSVRPQLISTYTTEELDLRCRHLFRHFLIPYDGTDAAKYLIEQVKQRHQASQARLEACHVCWIMDDCDRRDIPQAPFIEQAKTELANVKAELEALKLTVVTEVRAGNPVVEVIEAALEPDISAIAVSHNRRGTLLQLSVPSFAQDLLRHSWHPVLYFPFMP